MKNSMIIALAVLIAAGVASAVEFKVTEVRPLHGQGECKWAPDGTRFACLAGQTLQVQDTSGESLSDFHFETRVNGWQWCDDSELVVRLQSVAQGQGESHTWFERLNVNSRKSTQLYEYDRGKPTMDREANSLRLSSDRPGLTLDGMAFYRVYSKHSDKVVLCGSGLDKEEDLNEHQFLRVGNDAIYRVRCDLADSTRLIDTSHGLPAGNLLSVFSTKLNSLGYDGTIIRWTDNQVTRLDTFQISRQLPEGTYGCGYIDLQLNPEYPEAAFVHTCDDGEDYIVRRVGLFDLEHSTFTFLDSLTGINGRFAPRFAPNGRDILVSSDDGLYLIRREVRQLRRKKDF